MTKLNVKAVRDAVVGFFFARRSRIVFHFDNENQIQN